MFVGALLALALLVPASLTSAPSQEIRTPLQLVPLWSEEMLHYLTGRRQAACSGANALPSCQRVDTGVCDDTAYFRVGSPTGRSEVPFSPPPKQTGATRPQAFRLELTNAGYSSVTRTFEYSAAPDSFELEFNCSFSGNDGCPGNRFQTGAVKRVTVSLLDGAKSFDLTAAATVRPDGPIVVRIDGALKAFLLEDASRIYQLRAVSECFSVAPSPVEWTIPVYRSYGGTDSTGAVVVRVLAGTGMTFAYRRATGGEVPFEPDWVQPDWGYTFLMEQTFLDRKDDWFLLPARPFESPVWIRLSNRTEPSQIETGVVYTLSKAVTGMPGGSRAAVTVAAGNIVVIGRQGPLVEIRKEEPFDMPCADGKPGVTRTLQTYLIDVAEFYDPDRHLQLRPAYPKGC